MEHNRSFIQIFCVFENPEGPSSMHAETATAPHAWLVPEEDELSEKTRIAGAGVECMQ